MSFIYSYLLARYFVTMRALGSTVTSKHPVALRANIVLFVYEIFLKKRFGVLPVNTLKQIQRQLLLTVHNVQKTLVRVNGIAEFRDIAGFIKTGIVGFLILEDRLFLDLRS
jgi:hypothetical protein